MTHFYLKCYFIIFIITIFVIQHSSSLTLHSKRTCSTNSFHHTSLTKLTLPNDFSMFISAHGWCAVGLMNDRWDKWTQVAMQL